MPDDLREEDYNELLFPYDLCSQQMEEWTREFRRLLIERLENKEQLKRVFYPRSDLPFLDSSFQTKSFNSVIEKVKANKITSEGIWKLPDLARGRIICVYLAQAEHVSSEFIAFLETEKGCRIESEHSGAKESGYRSFHHYLNVPVNCYGTTEMIPFELQVRSELQHTWAQREHPLVYKNYELMNKETEDLNRIKDTTRALSERLNKIDEAFDEVREDVFDTLNRSTPGAAR